MEKHNAMSMLKMRRTEIMNRMRKNVSADKKAIAMVKHANTHDHDGCNTIIRSKVKSGG